MKKGWFGILIILCILVIGTLAITTLGPFSSNRKVADAASEPQKVTQGAKERIVMAKGIVESEEEIEIGSQVASLIKEMKAEEGDTVRKGALLVILDNEKILTRMKRTEAALKGVKARLKELEAGYRAEDIEMARSRLRRAEAIVSKARDEYERQKRLYQKDATTLVELDRAEERTRVAVEEMNEAKANLEKLQRGVRKEEIEQAKAAVEREISELNYQETLIKDYTLVSPIDGLVIERLRDPNETVKAGTAMLKIIDPAKLRVRAELEESDVGQVVEGQRADITTDAYRDKVYHGRVYKVFPVVKKKALRTFDPAASLDISTQGIYIKIDDFSGLKTGITVTVKFLK